MFFVLSKTLSYLALPTTIICLCFLLSVLISNGRWKKRFFWTGFALLFFFTNEFVANEVMLAWEVQPKAYRTLPKHKLAIVLTGATIPLMEPNDRVYFARGADRVTHTVQLYKLGLINKILISGGSGRMVDIGEREADKFKDAMELMGVPVDDIIIENQTRNTHESAVEVKKLLADLNLSAADCLLVTSAFHMRRSLACYRKVGLEIEPFSTDFYGHDGTYYPDAFIVPKIDALVIWHKLSKEWIGFVAYKMAGYI